jgi:hypothetical protein
VSVTLIFTLSTATGQYLPNFLWLADTKVPVSLLALDPWFRILSLVTMLV